MSEHYKSLRVLVDRLSGTTTRGPEEVFKGACDLLLKQEAQLKQFVEPDPFDETRECSWCGGDPIKVYRNKQGEVFCSPSHRSSSNRARRKLEQAGG